MDSDSRESNVAANPVASACAFRHILHAIRTHLFGWDIKTGAPPDGKGGVWGRLLCYMLAIEEQYRGAVSYES